MIYKRTFTIFLAAALLLAATSCVKDELHNTPHPDTGKITVTADWTDRGEGVDIPAEWTVTMGDYTGTETGEAHAPDYLFNPGDYTLAVYNIPENITISGTTATVAPDSKVRVGQKEEFQGLRRRENRSVLSYMRIFTVVHEDFRFKRNAEITLFSHPHQQCPRLAYDFRAGSDHRGRH